ncbi:hypothetical protein ACLOJK_012170 [Asimina triloba]
MHAYLHEMGYKHGSEYRYRRCIGLLRKGYNTKEDGNDGNERDVGRDCCQIEAFRLSFGPKISTMDSYEHFGAAVNYSGALYDCKVDPYFIGYAKPWRDLDSGYSYCLFFPHTPEHLVRLVPKLKAVRIKSSGSEGLVYVSIIASLREAPEVMGSTHAPFIGGFSILEMGKVTACGEPENCITFINDLVMADADEFDTQLQQESHNHSGKYRLVVSTWKSTGKLEIESWSAHSEEMIVGLVDTKLSSSFQPQSIITG